MDSMHTDCFAKYANDTKGSSNSVFKNNAKITLDDDGNVCIIATKHIKSGSEIFCGYGKRYWKKHH
nr:SET domain-containing protein-lysine N-methyltransferase [Olleya namhaensis]